MERQRIKKSVFCAIFSVALVISLAIVAGVGGARRNLEVDSLFVRDERTETPNFGTYTFKRSMTLADGSIAEFFESGDEKFKYNHDADGYVLLRNNENATLEYAVNDNGRPASSGVSFNAGARVVDAVPKMTADEIDLEAHPDLLISYDFDDLQEVNVEPLFGSQMSGTVVNLVIYITFNDVAFTPGNDIVNMFNGNSNSLQSYYRVMSNNAVNIVSKIPYDGTAVYVYKDSKNRNYYNTDGSDRKSKEAELLTNAVAGAKEHFSGLNAYDLDVNDDGYLDSLSFVIAGDSSSTWGSLLWPHSWNLDSIDGAARYSSVTDKNGEVKVGKYSFNFASALNTGVICHEIGHVLGAPDLYHYNYDFVPVGKWDLMQFNQDVPQYMLSYMRDKYVGGIGARDIEDITANGVYSLSPVSSVQPGNVLAYRIPTARTGEYFMVEYRRVMPSGYDSSISGSGLVVYRIEEPNDFANSEGNQNAVYKSTGKTADEVYVFRPHIKMTGTESSSVRYQRSKEDVEYGYMSPDNPYYSELGTTTDKTRYSPRNLFFTDGTNSGITIKTLSISGSSIEFSIHVSDDTDIPDNYFNGRITVSKAEIANTTEFAGVSATVDFSSINISYLSALELTLLAEDGSEIATNAVNTGRLLAEYRNGVRSFESRFVYADKGNSYNGVFGVGAFTSSNVPKRLRMRVTDADGDVITLATVAVTDASEIGWDTVLSSKTERSAMISASATTTVGVKRSGNVVATGAVTGSEVRVLEDVIGAVSAASGQTHILVLLESLTVKAVGSDKYGEASVQAWTDIKAVAAGEYTSYGLKTDGTVVSAGANNNGQLAVGGWTNVTAISAKGKRVAGVTKDGKVLYAGVFSEAEKVGLGSIDNAQKVACGSGFVAVLLKDGTVRAYGMPGLDALSWTDITDISAGDTHLLGLKSDGKVVAVGDNAYNQCYVSNLYDIIGIAAGESHSAFLRIDGVVEYRGLDKSGYGVNKDIGNLIYNTYTSVSSVSGVSAVGNSGSVIRVPLGGEVEVDTTFAPQNATYVRMIYSSLDISVASVRSTGAHTAVIRGNSVGQTIVYVVENGSKIGTSVSVEVYKDTPLTGIAFADDVKSVLAGNSIGLKVKLIPIDAVYVGEIVYTSSNLDVASVDSNGTVTAHAVENGSTCVITATLGGFTATCSIVVVSEIGSAEVIVGPTAKTKYRYGEALSTDGFTLRVTIGGNIETTHFTTDMVTGYDPTGIGVSAQTLTVNYFGATATFNVSVKDYVVGIEMTESPKSLYLYDEEFETSGKYKIIYASGKTTDGNAFEYNKIEGYNKRVVGTQYVGYTHIDNEWGKSFGIYDIPVSVLDYASRIALPQSGLVQKTYLYEEQLDMNEQVELWMVSGVKRNIYLYELDVRDVDSPVTDKDDAYYALYSKRTGIHKLSITYVDSATDNVLTTDATITVNISGEFVLNGKEAMGDKTVYYYEQGGSVSLGVNVIQKGVNVVEISSDRTAEIHYELFRSEDGKPVAFDNTALGLQPSIIRIYVNKQTDVGVESVNLYDILIDAYGLMKATSISVRDTSVREYEYGYAINSDKDNLDIVLSVRYTDGHDAIVAPMEVRYDPHVTGSQTAHVRYLNTWLEFDIIIKDYINKLEAEDVTIIYGDVPETVVIATYANRGATVLKSSEYTLSAYDVNKLGKQIVTVTYKDDQSFTTTFELNVIDAFGSIKITREPKREYQKGEPFDPSSEYEITMRSGAKVVVKYNSKDFEYSPEFNSDSIRNPQDISIYYKSPNGKLLVWCGECDVPNYVKALVVLSGYTTYEYKYGEALVTQVRADYADGSSTVLSSDKYTTDYNSKKIGVQTVTISYSYRDKVYKAYIENVRITDSVDSVKLVSTPLNVKYRYGQAITFAGAVVEVVYAGGGKIRYEGANISKELTVSYSTLVEGFSDVVISVDDRSVTYRIEVSRETNAISADSTDTIKIDVAKRTISISKPATVGEIVALVKQATYLTPYVIASEKIKTATDAQSDNVSTGHKIVYKNDDGVEVFVFVVAARGDADGNGIIDAKDVEAIAQDIVSGKVNVAIADNDGDGRVNLTDLVLWARETSGEQPKNAPVKELAELWVSDVKPRKTKEDSDNEEA